MAADFAIEELEKVQSSLATLQAHRDALRPTLHDNGTGGADRQGLVQQRVIKFKQPAPAPS